MYQILLSITIGCSVAGINTLIYETVIIYYLSGVSFATEESTNEKEDSKITLQLSDKFFYLAILGMLMLVIIDHLN